MCLVAAVVAFLGGVAVSWVADRHFTDRGDVVSTGLLYIFFPAAALTGTASAVVFLILNRRRQFAIELAIGLLLVFYFFTWESL